MCQVFGRAAACEHNARGARTSVPDTVTATLGFAIPSGLHVMPNHVRSIVRSAVAEIRSSATERRPGPVRGTVRIRP